MVVMIDDKPRQSRQERQRQLAGMTSTSRPTSSSPSRSISKSRPRSTSKSRRNPGKVHRRAVLAGAPTSTADPRRLRKDQQRAGLAVTHRRAMDGAKRGGARTVTLQHPGSEGHERCREICLSYA